MSPDDSPESNGPPESDGPPESNGPPASTGPPDRETLRLLERHLADDPLVAQTAFEPSAHEPRLLVATLDAALYPETVERARLDVRWFTSGDFSVHYVEVSAGGTWECRWDRHPNEHAARLHFHRPPDCEEIVDLSLPTTHPLDVYATVLAAVEERIETRWSE
jgi:hypothetical protein